LAHDHLVAAPLKGTPFDDLEVVPHFEGGGLDPAERHVGIGAGGPLGEIENDEELRGGEGAIAWEPPRPLIISLLAPLRRMIALSAEPETVMAWEMPLAMESTATRTATTPAIPNTAAVVEPLRVQTVLRLKWVSEAICRIQLMGPAMVTAS
jgi:hypothetical protein